MSQFCRLLVCNVLLAGLLTGCSTPGTRARTHATALHRLAPADQQMVLHGGIRPGMSQDAVYIAWGEPDARIAGSGDKSTSETWVYRQRVTLLEPMNSYYYSGPYHGFGDNGVGRGFLPGYAYGGIGYEGALRYQPHVRSLDSVRIAEFSGGKVDRYKSADGTWHPSRQLVAESGHGALTTLTARHTDRTFPHVAHRPVHSVHTHNAQALAHHIVAGSAHRLHHVANASPGKKDVRRAASDSGSKAGPGQQGSHGSHPGSGVHHLGHSHLRVPGHPHPRAA